MPGFEPGVRWFDSSPANFPFALVSAVVQGRRVFFSPLRRPVMGTQTLGVRAKPHVNVGTIGHIDHGKTTLTAALSLRSARRFPGRVQAVGYERITAGGTRR